MKKIILSGRIFGVSLALGAFVACNGSGSDFQKPESTTDSVGVTGTGSSDEESGNAATDFDLDNIQLISGGTITGLGGAVVFTEDAGAVSVDSDATISDNDYHGATLEVVVTGSDVTNDVLSFSKVSSPTISESGSNIICNEGSNVTVGTLDGSSTNTSKSITLAGTGITQTCMDALLQSVQFNNTNTFDPATDDRTVTYTYTDVNSNTPATGTVTVQIVTAPDDPTFSNLNSGTGWTSGMPEYTEGAGAVTLDSNATVVDDSTAFTGATLSVTLTNGLVTEDHLSFDTSGPLGVVGGTNVQHGGTTFATLSSAQTSNDTSLTFTFTGNATASFINTLVQAISYNNTNNEPNDTDRKASFVFVDAGGNNTGTDNNVFIDVIMVNDPPTVTGDFSATFFEGAQYNVTTSDLFYNDPDDVDSGITFSVTSRFNLGSDLIVNGAASNSFTGTQLAANQVFVEHDGSETTSASFSVSVADGGEDGASAAVGTVNFTIIAQNDDPSLTGFADTIAFAEDDSPTDIESGGDGVVTDVDSSDFESGSLTISFTPSDAGQEILSIDTSGTISFNASNNQVSHSGTVIGTLDNTNDGTAGTMEFTFNGNATPAAVSALLNAIQYVHNADNPTAGDRTLTITVTDGDGGSASESGLTVNVTASPDQADISALGGTVVYTEDAGAIAVDDNATISDGDDVYTNSTLAVVVSGNDVSDDSLSFSLAGTPSITENGSNVECNEGSGAVTLGAITGTDTSKLVTMASSGVTQGCVQALLRSVQFNNGNSFEPADDDRTVSYTYTGPDTIQTTGSVTIDFVTAPDNPTFSNLNSGTQWVSGMPEFVESAAAIAIDSDVTLDDDTTNFNSATLQVTIGNAVATEDDLSVASSLHNSIASITNGGVNGTNDTTVTFTFNGSATESDIISLLQGVKYDNTNDDNPSSTEREISVVFTDVGGLTTGTNSVYVKITPQNDDPVISNFSNTPAFTEDGTSFVTVDNSINISDPDVPLNFNGGTLTISVYATTPTNVIAEDQLDFDNSISIGTVTALDNQISVALDGNSTIANVTNFIEAIGYKNTNTNNPDTTTRTVSVELTDGQGGTATATTSITIVALNDAPTFVGLGGTITFTEAQTALALIDSDATVTDNDGINFNGGSLVVSISSNAQSSEDNLSINTSGNLSVSGTNVRYNGTTFALLSQTQTSNDTSLTFSFDSDATTTEVNTLIQALYYDNTNDDNPDTTTRTVSLTFTDIADTSQTTPATGSVDVSITAQDDNPILSISDTPNYTEESVAIQVAPTATLTDPDGTDFASGTLAVDITANYLSSEDTLSVGSVGGITLNGNAISSGGVQIASLSTTSTGLSIFTLPGATQSQVEALVQAITYVNSNSDDPSILNRTVTFSFTDASSLSSGNVDVTLAITPVNDRPVLSNTSDSVTYVENASPTLLFANVGMVVTDVDSTTTNSRDNFNGGFVYVDLAQVDGANEVLSVKSDCTDAGEIDRVSNQIDYSTGGTPVTIGNIDGSSNTGVGQDLQINLTSHATQAIVSELLKCLTYENTSEDPTASNRAITVRVDDGDSGTSETDPDAVSTVTVEAQNDTPVIGYANSVLAVNSDDDTTSTPLSQFTVTDEDSADTLTLTIFQYNESSQQDTNRLNGVFSSSTLGSFVDNGDGSYTLAGVTPSVAQAAVRALSFDPTDNQVEVGQTVATTFEISVVDSSSLTGEPSSLSTLSTSAQDSLTLTITSINDAPVLIPTLTSVSYSEGVSSVSIGNITITDADLNDTVTINLQIAAQNWPDDPNAPTTSDKVDSTATHPQLSDPPPSPIAVQDLYGADVILACGNSCSNVDTTGSDVANGLVQIVGTPTDVTAALVGATMQFHIADSSIDPAIDDRNSDYNFNSESDFDLDTVISLSVTDETTGSAVNQINVNATGTDDPPHAILTYESSCDPIAPGCTVTVFGGWSYDPDEDDSIATYRFYSDNVLGSTVTCGSSQLGIDSSNPCTLSSSDTPSITHTVPNSATGIAFRLEVEDESGDTNVTTLDDLDIVSEGVPNQTAFVQVYFGDIECSPSHAKVSGGPYVDSDNNCFCDVLDCTNGSAECTGVDGNSCTPTTSCSRYSTADGMNIAGGARQVFTACGYDPDLTTLNYQWEVAKTVSWSTEVISVDPSSTSSSTTTNTADVTSTDEQDEACYCVSETEIDTNGNGIPNCYFTSGAVCRPVDVDGNNVADEIATPSSSPTITPNNGEPAFTATVVADAQFLSSNQASIRVGKITITDSSDYYPNGAVDIQVTAYDGEDPVSSTVSVTYCDGSYEDGDNDGYGDPDNYYVDCGGVGTYYLADGSTTSSSPPTNYLSASAGNMSGIDCADDGSVTDDSSLFESTSTVDQSLANTAVASTVSWYIDADGDEYGSSGNGAANNSNRLSDDNDGDGFIDDADLDGVDDTSPYPVVYGDLDGDGSSDDCFATAPSSISRTKSDGITPDPDFGWWPETGGHGYVLNNDDCNDTRGYTDSGGQLISAVQQNPEMVWYVDFDEDGYGLEADGFASESIYLDGALNCYCDSTCSNCVSRAWSTNGTSVSVSESPGCTPTAATPDGESLVGSSCYDFAPMITQCEDPQYDGVNRGSYDSGTSINPQWTSNVKAVDCNDGAAHIYEGAAEVCDDADEDEDCNGEADDNDAGVTNAVARYADADSDGFTNENDSEFSCDGSSSSSSTNYQEIYFFVPSAAVDSISATSPVSINQSSSSSSTRCVCPESTCSYGCRLRNDLSTSCDKDTRETTLTCDEDTEAYDPLGAEFFGTDSSNPITYFSEYAFDCDDGDDGVHPSATEECDGVLNDCNQICGEDPTSCTIYSSATPTNEIDYDNDNFVECEFQGGTWRGSSAPQVGSDCSPDDQNVYPYASSVCDGQYNDCNLWSSKHSFYTDFDNDGTISTTEKSVQLDDCYCNSDACDVSGGDICLDSNGNSCVPVTYTVQAEYDTATEVGCYCTDTSHTDCKDNSGNVCVPTSFSTFTVASECTALTELFSAGAPDDQIDNDGDCFVECFDGNSQWKGSLSLIEECTASTGLDPGGSRIRPITGLDCDDNNQTVYPNASEICDGVYNDCNAAGWSATNPPSNEADNDTDAYVICTIDVTGWDGDETVVGGDDCDDNNAARYPTANEICDGEFNDCDSEFLTAFAGVSGEDCYCSSENTTDCVDSSGESCTPDSSHEANSTASSFVQLSSPPNSSYPYQYVECFCLSDDCTIDEDGDGLTDCLHADRTRCEPLDENGDGLSDSCITDNPADMAQTFTAIQFYADFDDGAPARETDDDGDFYVECNYNSTLWNGSPFVQGGDDCFDDPDDLGARVYPDAADLCDGLFNDCNAGDFSLTAVPDSEQDLDGDGWIGCNPDDNSVANIPWSTEVVSNPTLFTDVDEDCYCGGRDTNGDNIFDAVDTDDCVDSNGAECNPCANPADPATDLDQATCLAGIVQIGGFDDCNDTDSTVYPDAPEYCDGQYNDCILADTSTRVAPLDEIDNDGDGQVECRYYLTDASGCLCSDYLKTDGSRDCQDIEGNSCAPVEDELEALTWAQEDAVTYADCQDTGTNAESIYYGATEVCDAQFNDCSHAMISTNPITGGNYYGVVSDCLCVDTDCMIDIDGDSVSDCVDNAGDVCDPVDANGDNYADECSAELNDTGVEINNVSYKGVVPDCYCATTNCLSDYNSDGTVDCYTSTGDVCEEQYNTEVTAFENCVSDDQDLGFIKNLGTQPFEEVDNDGDNYVECTQFDLVTWRDQGGSVLIEGGSDCDDLDADVYPSATELCDGQLNACPTDPEDYVSTDLPDTETDEDGDGFVDCTQENGETWVDEATDPEGAAAHFVDSNDCYCDGDCSNSESVCINLSGETCTPDTTTCVEIGGFGDCDDDVATGRWVFPDAPSLCDGRYNDCNDSDFSLVDVPSDEIDNDLDGYVSCADFDSATWTGDSAVVGGDDCNDTGTGGETIYPGATEQCDGTFNDCENLQQFVYEGVVGDCYCKTSDCQIDMDGDGISECLKEDGSSCEPIDRNNDNFADYCAESQVAVSIGGIDHFGVEADCYCPTSDCELESSLDSDSVLDCLTPEGAVCSAQDDGFGFSETCASGSFSHTFLGYNSVALTAPMNEIDHDGDGYVECEFGIVEWLGSPSVVGGEDCYDYDDLVYPAATIEYCDGQFNDCSDLLYNTAIGHFDNLAPEAETDDDGDGFVECEQTYNESWVNPDIEPNGFGDCNDTTTGLLVYPGADEACDGQYNNCSDGNYDGSSAPEDETDNDGDGYVECEDFDSTTWGGDSAVVGGDDCDDTITTGSNIYPDAIEDCDGQFNNCDHPQQFPFEGVIANCFCTESDCEIDPDGDGTSNCVDPSGQVCDPVDSDSNGYADNCAASTTVMQVNSNGVDYYGVDVSCYCPTSDCQLDVVDDSYTFDCVTPEGSECVVAVDNGLGFADDCAENHGATVAPHQFLQTNGLALTAPFFELDNDGDHYVDCEYVAASWEGSLNIQGGLDCDDADATVYPLADEACDGQYNDCENGWVANGAPGDEIDNDNDGWVECTREATVEWAPWNNADEPNIVYGADGSSSFAPYCVCANEACTFGCVDEAGNDCIVTPGYCDPVVFTARGDCDDTSDVVAPFVAEFEYSESSTMNAGMCMRDADYDGYGDSNLDSSSDPDDLYAGHDCDDENLVVHPQQDEVCESVNEEQIDTDCDGDVNTAASPYGLTNSLENLYLDADGDGFGDIDEEAIPACEVATGFVFNATDCDDNDSGTYPGAPEICDQKDQDCDLSIDEPESLAEPGISRCTYMYRDQDVDGYGDEDLSMCLCQQDTDETGIASPVEEGGYTYVIYSGDCWDSSSEIKPLSCADGIDNDADGYPDDEDTDCQNGYMESASILSDTIPLSELKEEASELLDGHDNDCDGFVAAIELDCDDDGTFPLVPADNLNLDRSERFQRASEIGLEACDPHLEGLDLSCWEEDLLLECDKLTAEVVFEEGEDGAPTSTVNYNGTGLWMLNISESADGFSGRFDGGYRKYPDGKVCSDAGLGDCDDHCSQRCPGQSEVCDGVDNDCSGVEVGADDDGIPDALEEGFDVLGMVSPVEMDIDQDGFLACDSFASNRTETQYTDKSCSDDLTVAEENDCNNFCFYTSPAAEERCDGFLGVCDGDAEGKDKDRDEHKTCGAWSGAGSDMTEDIFTVVWLKDVDWAAQGSEEVELIRPNNDAPTPEDIALERTDAFNVRDMEVTDSGLDSGLRDSGQKDSGMSQLEDDILPEYGESLPIINAGNGWVGGDVEIDELHDIIPLIIPRFKAPDCDAELLDQLTLLLGEDRMTAILDPGPSDNPAELILDACEKTGSAGCALVKLSLSEDTDEETYQTIAESTLEIPAFSRECESKPEQWISRTVWQRERIFTTRQTVVEWECKRVYGRNCDEVADSTPMKDDWMSSMVSAERWILSDRVWWKEMGRFNPEPIVYGTVMSCWGNPTDATVSISNETGGDCDDSAKRSHRDLAEGPGDLVGLYQTGDLADCSTCLDGIDNNCDGAIDCADPACARCFVGQGVGCGGGSESPCAQGGCSAPTPSGDQRMYSSVALFILSLCAVSYRRRKLK